MGMTMIDTIEIAPHMYAPHLAKYLKDNYNKYFFVDYGDDMGDPYIHHEELAKLIIEYMLK